MNIKIIPCGHGDCILFEWVAKNGTSRIGLIDCHKSNDSALTIYNYLVSNNYEELEFIILTHPHYDHYSGLESLLKLLNERKKPIRVNYYISNFDSLLSGQYLKKKKILINILHRKNFYKRSILSLLTKVYEYKKKGTILNRKYFTAGHNFPLDSDWSIYFCSPTSEELDWFKEEKIWDGYSKKEKTPPNNPNSNLLSYVCFLYNQKDNVGVLLNSDCTNLSMRRILNCEIIKREEVFSKEFLLFQMPHHGSYDNCYPDYVLKCANPNGFSFISIGKNTYKHPSQDAVLSCKKSFKEFYTTVEKLGQMDLTQNLNRFNFFDLSSHEDKDGLMLEFEITEGKINAVHEL